MMSPTRLLTLGLLCFALTAFALDQSRAAQPSALPSKVATAEACTVYRALFDFLRGGVKSSVGSNTVRLVLGGDKESKSAIRAPTRFTPADKSVADAFEVDTSTFIAPLMADEAISIRHCFSGKEAPSIYEAPADWSSPEGRAAIRGIKAGPLYQVSPVGFSPDGHYALLYEADICFDLCGSGSLVLFEKRKGVWVATGTALVWIS